jgi:1-acyl-sn-glycerol-3-phosphate acyltransferase
VDVGAGRDLPDVRLGLTGGRFPSLRGGRGRGRRRGLRYRPVWGRPEPVWRWAGPVASLGLRLLLRLRVAGVEHIPPLGPFALAPVHVSYLDPVVLQTVAWRAGRPLRFIVVRAAFSTFLSGWFLRASNQIPFDEGRGHVALLQAVRAAELGEGLCLYPEGGIPDSGVVEVARPGVGFLALRCGVPLLPVGTWGMDRTGGRARWRPRRRVGVVIGAPQELASPTGRTDRAAYAAAAAAALEEARGLVAAARSLAEE